MQFHYQKFFIKLLFGILETLKCFVKVVKLFEKKSSACLFLYNLTMLYQAWWLSLAVFGWGLCKLCPHGKSWTGPFSGCHFGGLWKTLQSRVKVTFFSACLLIMSFWWISWRFTETRGRSPFRCFFRKVSTTHFSCSLKKEGHRHATRRWASYLCGVSSQEKILRANRHQQKGIAC